MTVGAALPRVGAISNSLCAGKQCFDGTDDIADRNSCWWVRASWTWQTTSTSASAKHHTPRTSPPPTLTTRLHTHHLPPYLTSQARCAELDVTEADGYSPTTCPAHDRVTGVEGVLNAETMACALTCAHTGKSPDPASIKCQADGTYEALPTCPAWCPPVK